MKITPSLPLSPARSAAAPAPGARPAATDPPSETRECFTPSPAAAASGPASSAPRLEYLGSIPVDRPAFLTIADAPADGKPALYVSSFRVFGGGAVSVLDDLGGRLGTLGEARPRLLSDDILWPNELKPLPPEAVGTPGLLAPSGFLVPGKSDGTLTILPQDDAPVNVAPRRRGWFYHRAEWRDVNGDGRLDLVAARAQKPLLGSPGGKLVWLEQPAEGLSRVPWTEHPMASGPDVHFRLVDLDGDGREEVIAAEFFSRRLAVYWQDSRGKWQSQQIDKFSGGRVVDSGVGSAFDLEAVDLNGDGRLEILVTNHESDGRGAVYAYEVPRDSRGQAWPRHTLMENITTRPGFSSAAPGAAVAFHPNPAAPEGKPWILLAGDGAQKAWVLAPASSAPGDWSYTPHEVVDGGVTVGRCAVADVDGDGSSEVFVPLFERNEIRVFRLHAPSTPDKPTPDKP